MPVSGGQAGCGGVRDEPPPASWRDRGPSRQLLVANALGSLGGTKENFVFCDALNISVCPLTEAAGRVSTPGGRVEGLAGSTGSRRS